MGKDNAVREAQGSLGGLKRLKRQFLRTSMLRKFLLDVTLDFLWQTLCKKHRNWNCNDSLPKLIKSWSCDHACEGINGGWITLSQNNSEPTFKFNLITELNFGFWDLALQLSSNTQDDVSYF